MKKEKFDFDEFMGVITFMIEENFSRRLIEDMRIVLEKKVQENETAKEKLLIFDWHVKNFTIKENK